MSHLVLSELTRVRRVMCMWIGCSWLQYIASCWNHDGDPVQLLKLGSQVARFRQCLKENPQFLQEKVKQYFKVRKLENLCEYMT